MECSFIYRILAMSGGLLYTSSLLGAGFGGPEVLKLDWAMRSLSSADVDADGLNDLVVVNNDLSKIEILYQNDDDSDADQIAKRRVNNRRWEPVLEDARFSRSSVAVGFPIFDMIVDDLNNDGRVDLAYTASEVPLTIRYQSEDGMWSDTQEFDGFEPASWTDTLSVADLDSDGRLELLLISSDALRVFYQNQSNTRLSEPERFYITGENPYNMMVEDVSGDGLPDVMYLSANGKQSLALRLQRPDGSFGPERRFPLDRPMRRIRVLSEAEDDSVRFCGIDSRSGSLEFFELCQQEAGSGELDLYDAQPEVYPLKSRGRGVPTYALCDLNGDGLPDLVSSHSADSELLVMMGQENDRFAFPESYPTLSEINDLTGGYFYSKVNASIVVASSGENMVGLSGLDGSGRMTFPKLIRMAEGETPEVCVAMDVDRDGLDELLLVVSTKKSNYLLCLRPSDRSDELSGWEELSRYELTTVRRKPNAMEVLDIFGANRHGIMLFVAREAPVFLVADQGAPYEFREFATESTIRESLLKDVLPTQVSVFDADGKAGNELVVGRKGYARALSMTDDDIEMIDQFNARRGEDVISCVIPVERSGDVVELMFYVPGSGELQLLKREEDAVFRYHATNSVGAIKLLSWEQLGSQSGSGAYLFAGQDRFWRLPQDGDRWARVLAEQFETDLDGIHYTHIEVANFAVDSGDTHVIAVDGQSHVVEIIRGEARQWSSAMYWEIFEQNMHYQGRTGANLEPRQILIAELNGDDLLDFAFLVHDRILIYTQE